MMMKEMMIWAAEAATPCIECFPFIPFKSHNDPM